MTFHDVDKLVTVAAAQATTRQLEQQYADLVAQRDAVNAERENLAFEALTSPGGAAQKRLSALTDKAARVDLEIQNAFSALTESRRRIAAAVAAQEHEARCADARRAIELADELRDAGTFAGEALQAFVARYQRVQQVARDLHRLGIGSPHADVVRVNAERAIATSLGPLGLAPLLQPSQRCDLPAVIEGYCQRAESHARAILDGADNEEAAA
jgi:hypothetical protein